MFESILKSFTPKRLGPVISGLGRKFTDVLGGGLGKAEGIFGKATQLPVIGGIIEKSLGQPVRQALGIGRGIENIARRFFQKPEKQVKEEIMANYPALD